MGFSFPDLIPAKFLVFRTMTLWFFCMLILCPTTWVNVLRWGVGGGGVGAGGGKIGGWGSGR